MTEPRDSATDPTGTDPGIRHLRDEAIRLFRAGGELSHHHKEGGERLFFHDGLFTCERYGDNGNSRETFTSPEAFLDRLWRGWYWKHPGQPGEPELSDLAAWQKIVDLLAERRITQRIAAGSSPEQTRAVAFYHRYRRLTMLVALFAAALFIVAGLFWNRSGGLLQVRTIGSPAGGEAIGTPDAVLIMISRLQPYMPSLHRDPSKDRYDLSLLVEPRKPGEKRRLIPIAEGYQAGGSLQHDVRPVGFDGRVAWFHADELTGWDTIERKLVTAADVRRVNPALTPLWDEAFYEVNDGLIASTRDNRIVVRIDPKSLQAALLDRRPPPARPFPPHPVDSWRIDTDPAEPDARMTSWLRSAVDAPELRLEQPGSRVRIHYRRTGVGVSRVLIAARIDDAGQVVWSADTGIDELQQILPDPGIIGFIGTTPAEPGKYPRPIISFVDTRSGAVRTESLEFGR